MATEIITEDRDDYKRTLAQHTQSGDRYIVEYCSLWQHGEPVGTRIIRSAGPIYYGDLQPEGGPIEPSVAVFDRIDSPDWELTDEDADWLQAEEDAGRLAYPIGAR